MFDFWSVYKRELKTYLQSPSTYVVIALFFLYIGREFQDSMFRFSIDSSMAGQQNYFGQVMPSPDVTQAVIRRLFGAIFFVILFTIPLLSMRLIAEERSRGTFELLVTSPISDWAILLGKYFALVTIGLLIIGFSVLYPLIVWWAGSSNQSAPEWPVVISCWIGLFLIFATYAAFGLMASSFTENQITAGVITLIGLLLWFLLGIGQGFQDYPQLANILREFSAISHVENFVKGVLVLKDFAFFILASFLFLFIASKTLDARRWRV